MSEKRQFWTLVLYLGAAQAAINIPVWSAAGQTFVSHIYLALISAASVAVFAVIARTSHAGAEASSYVQFLLTEFLYTVGVAVIFIVISPAGGPVACPAAGLAAAAALLAVTATDDLAARSYLLDLISRRIFRQRLSPGFGLPGSDFGEADIREAIPSAYPPPAVRGDEPSPQSEPGHPDERRGPRSDELTEDVARGTAWAEGLLATASVVDPTPGMPTPVMTSVGFVQSRDNRAKLAVIHYFRPRRAVQGLAHDAEERSIRGRVVPGGRPPLAASTAPRPLAGSTEAGLARGRRALLGHLRRGGRALRRGDRPATSSFLKTRPSGARCARRHREPRRRAPCARGVPSWTQH